MVRLEIFFVQYDENSISFLQIAIIIIIIDKAHSKEKRRFECYRK